MKKLIALAIIITLFALAGKKVETKIQNATAKATGTAPMMN